MNKNTIGTDYIRKLLAQQKSWKEQLRSSGMLSLIDSAQRVQEQFRSSGVFSAIADAQRIQEQFRSSSMFSAIADAQRIQEQFRSSGVFSAIADAQRIQEQFRSSGMFSAIAGAQRIQEQFVSVITRLSKMSESLQQADYVINADGTIAGQNTFFTRSEVQRIIESYLEQTPIQDNVSLEIKIDQILNNLAKAHPIIKKIVVHILLSIFINVISPYFSPATQNDYAAHGKQIKKEVRQIEVGPEFYKHYRFVSKPSLIVWSKSSKQSGQVGKLYYGYLVRILHKKKNWSLIEYRSIEGDIIIQGWVFTRYIKKFD